jgi:hypothetical protein
MNCSLPRSTWTAMPFNMGSAAKVNEQKLASKKLMQSLEIDFNCMA